MGRLGINYWGHKKRKKRKGFKLDKPRHLVENLKCSLDLFFDDDIKNGKTVWNLHINSYHLRIYRLDIDEFKEILEDYIKLKGLLVVSIFFYDDGSSIFTVVRKDIENDCHFDKCCDKQ